MAKNGKRVAEHALLDAQGNEIEEAAMETAVGYSYTQKGTGEEFEWYYSNATEDEKRMYALLGVKTKATNTASGIRNDKKNPGSPADEMAAVREHFERVRTTGKWAGERAGFSYDHPVLAEATLNVLRRVEGWDEADVETWRQRILTDCVDMPDNTGVKKYLNVAGVEEEYRKIKGRKITTAADLLAGLHT